MDYNWGPCFGETDHWEGGYVNNPRDPGGETNRGVTKRVYDAYRRGKGLPIQSVHDITTAECVEIYQTQYWTPAHCNDLPIGVDLCQYDEAVNSGAVQATKLLQRALGVSADGVYGLVTARAVADCRDIPGLIKRICAQRLSFYEQLPTWRYFGGGWSTRKAGIEAKALSMFAASQSKGVV